MDFFRKALGSKQAKIYKVRGSLAVLAPHKQDYPFNIGLTVSLLPSGMQ